MFRLGINEEMATMLGGLTLPQMVKQLKRINWFASSASIILRLSRG